MASPPDTAFANNILATGIARTPHQAGMAHLGSQRVARDRFAGEKMREAQKRSDEYWRSIVPSSCALGLKELHLDEVFEEIQKRVRQETKYLCLIPPEDFSELMNDSNSPEPKRYKYKQWLYHATNIVMDSLNLDSPNPIGWDSLEDSFVLSRLQNGEMAPSYWILGAYCRLRGAQPWQATRSYISSKVYELLEAEGWDHWITSQTRWDALGDGTKPVIVKYLQDFNSDFNNTELLDEYAHKIWSTFVNDHLKPLSGQAAALAPLYALTENYVQLVGAKLERCGELEGTFLSSTEAKQTQPMLSQIELKSSVTAQLKSLQYDYFPLIQDTEKAFTEMADKVLEHMNRVVLFEDVSTAKMIANILNDFEDESSYLSRINRLFRVRICLSDIDPSVGSLDTSSFRSRLSMNESDSKMKISDNRAIKRSSASSESSSNGRSSAKRSKTSKAGSTKDQSHSHDSKTVPYPVTLIDLSKNKCNDCVLCGMPDCERCFACVANKHAHDGTDAKCCIRKMCCSIPTQWKGQSAVDLGLPEGWRFTFDDPEKCNLIDCQRIVAPAGMKLISPYGKQFNSLQSAFAHIKHSSVQGAIEFVESFLRGLGSNQYSSCPTHFLVGRDYCAEYMNEAGFRVALFGKIVGCMKGGNTPSSDVSKCDTTFFILQYRQDMLDAIGDSGVRVAPLQMITTQAAWGGCVASERKTMIRLPPKGVVASIEQSTPVETWIIPDMQWQEMVPHGSTELPQFTVVVRGYKLVFKAKVSNQSNNGQPQFGLFASCTPLKSNSTKEDIFNIRPGELVDLGVYSPLTEGTSKELGAFIAKNYIHSLKVGKWGFVGNDDNMVFDPTEDTSGELHESALTHSLSYVRKCNNADRFPTIHARIDPSGKMHFLFGISYQGNWPKYEASISHLASLFNGKEIEMTMLHPNLSGNNKRFIEMKYLQVIRMFQLEDIVPCFNLIVGLAPNATAARALPPKVLRRALRVAHCLELRTQELMSPPHESSRNNTNSFLAETLLKLKAIKKMLEGQVKD